MPIPLRYWMAASKELTATVHTIIRRTIGQYDVHKAVQLEGANVVIVQPGSVTFVHRFGGSINVHLHVHGLFRERVFGGLHRPGPAATLLHQTPLAHGRGHRHSPPEHQPAGHPCAPPPGVSGSVYRGCGAHGGTILVRAADPELARTMAASVQQRIAFGERAGQQVRRLARGLAMTARTRY